MEFSEQLIKELIKKVPDLHNKSVIIYDPQDRSSEDLKCILKELQMSVSTAENYDSLNSYLGSYDIIIIDDFEHKLPLYRFIYSNMSKKILLIINEEELDDDFKELFNCEVISKPFNYIGVVLKIHEVLFNE